MRRTIGSGFVAAVGLVSLSVHFVHLSQERALHVATLGAILPLGVSVVLVVSGVALYRSRLGDARVVRVARWTGLGLVGGLLFGYPVIPYQAAHGVPMVDVPFVLTNYLTVGALAGSTIGYYDAWQDEYRMTLEATRDELRARERELRAENKRLDAFSSLVSHDLRNPMNVAAGRVELARETGDLDHLDPAADALDRMEAIIEDLLAVAREGSDLDEADLERVDVRGLVDDSWALCETGAATLDRPRAFEIRAAPSRLKHVFENLFRNAVEHGGDDVTVRVGPLDGDGFYVEDTGAGIPEDVRDQVFELGRSTDAAGTGLGLYLVERIADVHGWDVTVTDGPSGGARFEFTGVDVLRTDESRRP